MRYLKQSTATTLLIGPFVDETDGQTAETGLTISQADVLLWKEGGTTLAQKNDATSATHRSNGLYTVPVNTTDTNTLGILTVSVDESGALPVRMDYHVVSANVYDSLFGSGDVLDVSTTQFNGSAVTQSGGRPEVNVSHFGGTAGTFASGIPSASVTTSSINSIADQVWDEASSGHVAAGSFGAGNFIIRSNTAQSGSGTTIVLDASASATDDFYNNQFISIVAGTGVGQGRIISDYTGSSKTATVSSWITNPSSDSVFVIRPFGSVPGATAPTAGEVADAVWDEARADHTSAGTFGQTGQTIRTATAQAGSSLSITLDASASATDDLYNYNGIRILSGTGAGQSRQITDYNGTSKVATVGLAWAVNPASDSVFEIKELGIDAATVASVADAVWDEARSGHVQAGSFGEYVLADATRISGDAGAADNAESFFDGTGYAGTGNTIPTVTTVTNAVTANVTQISGDSTAADNLEAALDGTGGVTITAGVTGNITGNLSGSVGSVTGAVGSVAGNVDGSVGSVTTVSDKTGYRLSSTGVDDILDEAITEPAGVFAWGSATLRNIIGWLGARASNRETQTATTLTVRNRANSASLATSTVSDDGTTAIRGSLT